MMAREVTVTVDSITHLFFRIENETNIILYTQVQQHLQPGLREAFFYSSNLIGYKSTCW